MEVLIHLRRIWFSRSNVGPTKFVFLKCAPLVLMHGVVGPHGENISLEFTFSSTYLIDESTVDQGERMTIRQAVGSKTRFHWVKQ